MANVYEVISHPAFSRSLNSLLMVPLVARTSEVSAFAMKTPNSSCQSKLHDLRPDSSTERRKVARRETVDTPINRIEMTPAIFFDSSTKVDLSTSTRAASSSISETQGITSLNLALSFLNRGVRSSGTASFTYSLSQLVRFKVRVELVIAIEAQRRWRLGARDGVIRGRGGHSSFSRYFIFLHNILSRLFSSKNVGTPQSVSFLHRDHSIRYATKSPVHRTRGDVRNQPEVPSKRVLSVCGAIVRSLQRHRHCREEKSERKNCSRANPCLHASLDAKSCSPPLLSAISGSTVISCGCKAINLLTGRLRMLSDLAWLLKLV
jgi:hypothetical protein